MSDVAERLRQELGGKKWENDFLMSYFGLRGEFNLNRLKECERIPSSRRATFKRDRKEKTRGISHYRGRKGELEGLRGLVFLQKKRSKTFFINKGNTETL